MRRIGPGSPEPLGLTLVPGGANVAVFSAHASAIELCLFDAAGRAETARIALPERTGDVFHGFIAGIAAGQRYGLRAFGPYDPRHGHRFNPAKLLLDPHATALDGPFRLHPALFGELADGATRSDVDSAPFVPKAVAAPPWAPAPARRVRTPWADTILYELHVRGATQADPGVAPALRGTCAGLAQSGMLAHLKRLGVTTVELMPVAATIDERHLARLVLTNYWGYNPVAMLVPDPRLAPGGIGEFRACVDALHGAGIEVVLDVVYNHTGEGDALGPTVSLRGLDNATYYRTVPGAAARYVDDAGCGNTLALDRAPVLRLAMDALRHYAAAGVDGFRFDLATALARRDDGFDPAAPLLQAIAQDPQLRELKLIAEPWDVGAGGYRLGAFPAGWGEWNDRYRDTVRRFWRGDRGMIADLATRIAGSADVFAARSRPPSRSINFVAAHDGFTLADLVAYAAKHNEANGEGNRDGTDANFSWNHGIEGATDDGAVRALRERDVKSLLATLLLSRGTPMLAMGDELGRTQRGNNNAYAQDSALAWIDWEHADLALSEFVGALTELRHRHPALRADRWLDGQAQGESGNPDVEWRHPDGHAMTVDDWARADHHVLVAVLRSPGADAAAEDRVAIAFNAGTDAIQVNWPDARRGLAWRPAIDTASPTGRPAATLPFAGGAGMVAARSVQVQVEEPPATRRRGRARVAPQVLDRLAAAAGIAPEWRDVSGRRHVVSEDTTHALLAAMDLDARTTGEARERLAQLAAAGTPPPLPPERCHLPPALRAGQRRFGLAAHLYALRRQGDQGIGDFTTLQQVAAATARAGGVTVGINPLHALFSGQRDRASPYHPSDRRFLDPIYIDVENGPDFAASSRARDLLSAHADAAAALSARAAVDYPGVWDLKRAVLEACFATFDRRPDRDPLVAEFDRFVAGGGQALREFAVFEALAATYRRRQWQDWPPGLRRPGTPDVSAFAARHRRRVRRALYLQWVADRQLAAAAAHARSSGLTLGLYRDLAVGAAPDGAEAWANPAGMLARGVSIGAPPDPFSPDGQVWDLPPPIPRVLTASGYAGFRELLAANMRHAGALRIDHAMGLARLFWIPDGATARDGAYVRYPLDDLIAVLAGESQRARCLVVGEDLGTVPEGFRERLDAADVLSYRIVWFEREGKAFVPPSRYPAKAAASVSTHDLPTIAGWWGGADIGEKRALGLLDEDGTAAARAERLADKCALTAALEDAGAAQDGAVDPGAPHDASITAAIHRYAAQTASALLLVQADDLAGESEALNLPGTDRERPNWRRRVGVEVGDLWTTPAAAAAITDLAARRGTADDDPRALPADEC
jgi:glycogen operon protein